METLVTYRCHCWYENAFMHSIAIVTYINMNNIWLKHDLKRYLNRLEAVTNVREMIRSLHCLLFLVYNCTCCVLKTFSIYTSTHARWPFTRSIFVRVYSLAVLRVLLCMCALPTNIFYVCIFLFKHKAINVYVKKNKQ